MNLRQQLQRSLAIVPPVTAKVRPLNERLHALIAKEQTGEITPTETLELDCLCRAAEAEQDILEASE